MRKPKRYPPHTQHAHFSVQDIMESTIVWASSPRRLCTSSRPSFVFLKGARAGTSASV